MSDGKAARRKFGKERLHVAQDRLASGGIAHMPKGRLALQPLDGFFRSEVVADQAEPPLGVKTPLVEGDDACRFLAAVLQSMKAECGECCCVLMAVNSKYTAFLPEEVAVEVEIEAACHCCGAWPSAGACVWPSIRLSRPCVWPLP